MVCMCRPLKEGLLQEPLIVATTVIAVADSASKMSRTDKAYPLGQMGCAGAVTRKSGKLLPTSESRLCIIFSYIYTNIHIYIYISISISISINIIT